MAQELVPTTDIIEGELLDAVPVCVAEQFSSAHRFEAGTQDDLDRAYDDCWELCGRPLGDSIHDAPEA